MSKLHIEIKFKFYSRHLGHFTVIESVEKVDVSCSCKRPIVDSKLPIQTNKYLIELVGLDSVGLSLSPLEACRVSSSANPNFSPPERRLQVKHFRPTTVLGTRRTPGGSCAAAGAAASAGHRLRGLGPGSEPLVRELSGGPRTRSEQKSRRPSTCSSHLEEAARTGESRPRGWREGDI